MGEKSELSKCHHVSVLVVGLVCVLSLLIIIVCGYSKLQQMEEDINQLKNVQTSDGPFQQVSRFQQVSPISEVRVNAKRLRPDFEVVDAFHHIGVCRADIFF